MIYQLEVRLEGVGITQVEYETDSKLSALALAYAEYGDLLDDARVLSGTAPPGATLCQMCHERPVSARPHSIFCDPCADSIGQGKADISADELFGRIKHNWEAGANR